MLPFAGIGGRSIGYCHGIFSKQTTAMEDERGISFSGAVCVTSNLFCSGLVLASSRKNGLLGSKRRLYLISQCLAFYPCLRFILVLESV
jgi:hypothetical protein